MKVSPRQLEQLIQDLEDGCLSAADHQRLLEVLSTDAVSRRQYCEHMAFSSAMHTKAEAEADLDNWETDGLKARTEASLFARSLMAAAAVLLLLGAIAAVVTLNRPTKFQVAMEAPAGSVWSMEAANGKIQEAGSSFRAGGTVVVDSGMVALTMESGTRLLVQGPARVKFPAMERPVVEEGCLWIDTAEGSEQFSVEGGGLLFQDIGTRFAVRVRSDQRPELHVVEGKVRVSDRSTGRIQIVPASGQALLFNKGGKMDGITQASDPFPGLPELLKQPKHYATVIMGQSPVGYWRMDARLVDDVLNSVPGGSVGKAGGSSGTKPGAGVELGAPGVGPADGLHGFGAGNKGARFHGGTDRTSAIINLDSSGGVSTEEGSVSFWFRREEGVHAPEILWFAGDDLADGFGPEPEMHVFLAESGRVQFFMEDGGKDVLLSSPRTSADGHWHQVVASWDDEAVALYVDGEMAARDSEQRRDLKRTFKGHEVRFGKTGPRSTPGSDNLTWFVGWADEIALWDRSLTADEVVLQYAAAVGE